MNATYSISEHLIEEIMGKISKINKRAAKCGLPLIETKEVGHTFEEVEVKGEDDSVRTVQVKMVTLEVSGETPKFAGWTFAAVLEPMGPGENLIRKSPDCGVDLLPFATCAPKCDHCKAIRNRKETYVLLNEDGRTVQIGSTCIRDFLGGVDPHNLCSAAEAMFAVTEIMEAAQDNREFDGGGGHVREYFPLDKVLGYTAAVLAKRAYVSRSAARQAHEEGREDGPTATADEVKAFYHWHADIRNRAIKDFPVTEATQETAEKALEFVRADMAEPSNDFEHNMMVVAKSESIAVRHFGFACYIVAHYIRKMEKEAAKAAAPCTDHYGTAGERYKKVAVRYMGSSGYDSSFGYCWVHRFWTAPGALLVWKTGSPVDYTAGDEAIINFTVKGHEEFRGTKQTKVTRLETWVEKVKKPKVKRAVVEVEESINPF